MVARHSIANEIFSFAKWYLALALILCFLSTSLVLFLALLATIQQLQEAQAVAGTEPLLLTWYDPTRGGINCDSDCSTFANGERITDEHYYGGNKPTAACIAEWMGLDVTIVGLGRFTCRDRGGAIVRTAQGIHIDILSKTAVSCPAPCRYIVHWQNGEFPSLPAALYGGNGYKLTQGWHGLAGWQGFDFVAYQGCGATLYAPANGTVTFNGRDGYVGPYDELGEQNTMLRIDAGDGSELVLLHGTYTAAVGQTVRAGRTIIGKESSIGNSKGCHTHLIKRVGETAVSFTR